MVIRNYRNNIGKLICYYVIASNVITNNLTKYHEHIFYFKLILSKQD